MDVWIYRDRDGFTSKQMTLADSGKDTTFFASHPIAIGESPTFIGSWLEQTKVYLFGPYHSRPDHSCKGGDNPNQKAQTSQEVKREQPCSSLAQ